MNINPQNTPWGVIFDWDGVVIDSSAYHLKSWELLAEEGNLPLPEDHFHQGFGMKNELIIPTILGWTDQVNEIKRLGDRKEELFRELIRKDGLEALPGVRDLLDELSRASVPCAVGSSTTQKNITLALELLGLEDIFKVIIAGEHVSHGKPDPEVFLLAADGLGLSPSQCVVIEDAHVGIEAARNGGMKVLAVATTHDRESLADADRVAADLAEVDPSSLSSLLQS